MKVILYQTRPKLLKRKLQWRWRMVAPNGRQLANGGEGYNNLADAVDGLLEVTGGRVLYQFDEPSYPSIILRMNRQGLELRISVSVIPATRR